MDWIWSPSIWVPPGYTWEDLKERKDLNYPESKDLWTYPFIIAALQLVLKYVILTPYVYLPIAKYFGVKCKRIKAPAPDEALEEIYKRHKTSPPSEILRMSAVSQGQTVRQVQRWLRQRAASSQDTTLEKFADCAWQLSHYGFCCSIGIFVLYDKPWTYDMQYCWSQFPLQSVSKGVWWYYMIALGFYWFETLTHFLHPKRSDSRQVLVHHICAIILISCSWICNITRLGTLTILLFECNDIPLLFAKLFGYCGKRDMMDRLFVVFVIVWTVTRLGIFPFGIMKHAMSQSYTRAGVFFHMYNLFIGLLFMIMIMNIMWTYSIIQVIMSKFSKGHVTDVRSSEEELSNEESDKEPEKRGRMKDA